MSNRGKCNKSAGAPSPGFPVRLGGVNELHAAFLIESRTRCPVGNTGSFALFCEGWDTTNLDTDRRVSHPLQRTQRMGHPSFCRANYRAQQNGVAILLNAGEKCRLGVSFEVVKTTPLIDRNGDDPAQGKESDDEVAEHTKVVVEFVDQIPNISLQVELHGQ